MILSKKRITKAMISLRGCAGWSAPLLFANPKDRFSYIEAIVADSQHSRTHLSPFARCTLGLSCHSPAIFLKNILCDHCLHDSWLDILKISTNREMIKNFKFDFLQFLTINSVTTGARDLNGTSQISLATHDAKGDLREI